MRHRAELCRYFLQYCFKNGILPIVLPQEDIDKLMDDAARGANAGLSIDLEAKFAGPMAGLSVLTWMRFAKPACW